MLATYLKNELQTDSDTTGNDVQDTNVSAKIPPDYVHNIIIIP